MNLYDRIRQTRTDPGLRREADMMGFYLSIALLATLSAGSDVDPHSQINVVKVVWGTTIGLALAHWFAIALSMRVVKDPSVHHTAGEMMVSQIAMAGVIALAATVVVLLLPPDLERAGARIVAAVCIAAIVGIESRVAGSTWSTSATRAAVALVLAAAIALAKLRVLK